MWREVQITGKKVITRVLGLTYVPCMDIHIHQHFPKKPSTQGSSVSSTTYKLINLLLPCQSLLCYALRPITITISPLGLRGFYQYTLMHRVWMDTPTMRLDCKTVNTDSMLLRRDWGGSLISWVVEMSGLRFKALLADTLTYLPN